MQSRATVVQGTVIGIFSDPIVAGQVTNDPSLGQSTYLNNTGTAVSFINNSTDPTLVGTPPQQGTGSALVWGASAGNSGPDTFSELIFFGNQIPANYHQPFQLGTITYANGTSDLTSLIFGATLSFYDNTVSPQTFLGSDTVIITTTSNLDQSIAQDADYFNICGNSSSICATFIEAYESTQGGTGVTVNLTGTIVGDPTLQINSVSLAPDQSMGGYLGDNPAVGATVPEVSSTSFFLIGLGLLAVTGWRRRSPSLHSSGE